MLFEGLLHVSYGQFYVNSTDDASHPLDEAFAGQSNGLCGAAVAGFLFLVTGQHTGEVPLSVQLHEEAPPLEPEWQEVVEASFRPVSAQAVLAQWGGGFFPLGLEEISYRVRYCARGFDEAHQGGVYDRFDAYLLQFWPAPPAPDEVIRQTGRGPAYWHRTIRTYPPPPTPQERAAAERAAREEQERRDAEAREQLERQRWQGRLPGERLGTVGGNAWALAQVDRDLVDAIVAADPAHQRRVAAWSAHRAYEIASLADLDWAAPGLAALDRGELPEFFTDYDRYSPVLFGPDTPRTVIASYDGRYPRVSQQAMAFGAVARAADPDPLRAALDALFAAVTAYGPDYPALLAQARTAFPDLERG